MSIQLIAVLRKIKLLFPPVPLAPPLGLFEALDLPQRSESRDYQIIWLIVRGWLLLPSQMRASCPGLPAQTQTCTQTDFLNTELTQPCHLITTQVVIYPFKCFSLSC